MLKVLYTNRCAYDCAYCANRISADVPRLTFDPRELADLTVSFHRRGWIKGLFLSSAVLRSPDRTMGELVKVLKILRREKGFRGYIHAKAIPGADPALVREAALFADRVSVNIELPSEESLRRLAPQKDRDALLGPMETLAEFNAAPREMGDRGCKRKKAPSLLPAGQSTQLIVGASPETDLHILRLAQDLYRRYGLRRIYYSAYVRVNDDPRLPALPFPPLLRESRLYQADWLLRRYGFRAEELLDDGHPFLDEELDPKSAWALSNLHLFPVEVNTADRLLLLRVPGIGVRSVERILKIRRCHSLDFVDLRRMGVALKKAGPFITCRGRRQPGGELSPETLRPLLRTSLSESEKRSARQLTLGGEEETAPVALDAASCLSGEI